jgi:AraC-like DNA-binding protein
VHQIRAVSLYSYLDVARFLGIDGLKLLAEAGISPTSLAESQSRLPAAAATRLLERSAAESHCDSFGLRMAQCRSFASLGPISLLLERLQNVGEVLEALITFPRTLSDVLYVAAELDGPFVYAKFDLVPPFSRRQAADLTVGLGFIALSGATQGKWAPEAVHFTHEVPEDRARFERFFQAPLDFNSSFNGFSFAAEALRLPLPLADPAMAENARRLLATAQLPAIPAPLCDHIRHSVILLLPEGRATISEVAKNLSLTPRVLQRQLQVDGLTFAGLLNEVRRELSRRYLGGSHQNLTSIGQSLGYSDLSSFTRWFDREFGMPPSAWRKAQREAAAKPPPTWRR